MVLSSGAALPSASAAMILVHGRGATAGDILLTAGQLEHPGFAFLAPEAPGGAWYPQPFTAPLEANEPWLTQSLTVLADLVTEVERFMPATRLLILGFSQGACLALEFAARNPRRYAGIVGWSGGLIGADGAQAERTGSLDATPVVLGCSDVDPYIAAARVRDTADVLGKMGARVDLRFYPGMGHEVCADEIHRVKELMADVVRAKEEVA